jgi:hypothetical protein
MAALTTLAQAWTDANDTVFIGRITIALEEQCYAVIAEATNVTNHVLRLAFAQAVTNGDPLAYGRKLAIGGVANALAVASTDTQIRALISTGFDTIAGIGK